MKPQQVRSLSAFAGVIFVTHFFGLNLHHLHRPGPNDREHDLNGDFWKRHRNMDNVLSNTSLSLPSHLRLPAGVRNPNIVFLNFAIHTSTICLHQAAIFKAENNQLTSSVIEQSRARCLLAAGEIASVMRMTGHVDVAGVCILFRHLALNKLISSDESVYGVLFIRRSSGVRPVPEEIS